MEAKEELKVIGRKLEEIERKIQRLNMVKQELKDRRQVLNDLCILNQSKHLGNDSKWNTNDFPWNKTLLTVLNSIFHLEDFRPYQLSAINATLSKKDVILIMPTGGGKSLCFQLPAMIDKGLTIVISPMISLMEDQVMNLKNMSVNAEMLCSGTSTQENTRILQMMVDARSGLKLLYVTPERLAKSKRFMSKLQKCYELGLLSRIAVDEVHCCSQWGHDFRPDYQYLMVLKGMFPDVPFIGLTATATSKIIVDIQKMISMTDCIVFKSSFNRPNLYYQVKPKPSSQKECLNEIESLLKNKFKDQSGIIYTTSIKDCDDLRQELRNRNCLVSSYHGQLDAALRSKIHKKWLTGKYQAIIATIAFGLGIDKPDVRFVIHHSLSKSMENFYQESGRAGRDGSNASCILFYRFADVFKLSTMVFTQKTGLENLYSVVNYCLNPNDCRRKLIASHFDENWESTDCNQMCDHCRYKKCSVPVDITKYCCSIYQLLQQALESDVKLTAQMLIDSWFGKASGKIKAKIGNIASPKFDRETGESIVAHLLITGYLKEDFHFTPYSTISYIKKGPKSNLVTADHQIMMHVQGKDVSNTNVTENKVTKPLLDNKTRNNLASQNNEAVQKRTKSSTSNNMKRLRVNLDTSSDSSIGIISD